MVLPDAERGYGHPGENHVHRSAAGLVHQQEREVRIRNPLKQCQHLMFHTKQLSIKQYSESITFATNQETRYGIPKLTIDVDPKNSDHYQLRNFSR
jgi:hypothetical protein